MRRSSAAAPSAGCCIVHGTLALLILSVGLSACATEAEAKLQLEVLYGRDNAYYYSIDVEPGDTFELHYVHSVSKSPVFGGFQITPDAYIQPLYTVYRAHGPGLPWPSDEHTRREDGALQITHEAELPREELRVWVSPLTSDRLEIHGDVVELSANSDQPRLVVIRVRD
ncbi:MAG: DUF1850 domain-containing protein [Spirochaetaceae bacterium]|nr:MAG: DUF1850 domain-containing protein [Spirochaetaceae bacterium]